MKPSRARSPRRGSGSARLLATRPPLRRWLLQFGAEAEVLKPLSLRRAVAKELESALCAYRGRKR